MERNEFEGSHPETERAERFLAVMFPHRDAAEHLELTDRPELLDEAHLADGILYDFHTDYRGVTDVLGIADKAAFEGSQVMYGRVIDTDSGWIRIQPIQYHLHEDRRGADQGYGDVIVRLRAASVEDEQVRVAELAPENYEDLLGVRHPEEPSPDWLIQQYGAYALPFAAMSGMAK